MAEVTLGLALAAYNAVANRWPPFQRDAYLPMNGALTAVLLALALGPLGLGMDALGLGLKVAHLMLALGAAVLASSSLFLLLASPAAAERIADDRVAGLSGSRLLYHVLLRVPLGTAVAEEVAFRGVLYGVALDSGTTHAALVSSLFFGLWHVGPTLNLIAANDPGAGPVRRWSGVVVSVVLTFAAGLALVWLREATGSIWAGVGVHAGLNSTATVAAVAAHRVSSRPRRA